uniref:Trafficking protein particle complex subunit 2-like protein n=1 Tax=Sus scrofa TaxID=9823 RepID=A0A8D0RCP4_PIG
MCQVYLWNYPLYIRSVPTENELQFHYMLHTSLDVVDEKISAMGKALVDQRELYLGLLYPTEDYKVYGYVTNSKVKFVMVVDSSNTALRDNEIRSVSAGSGGRLAAPLALLVSLKRQAPRVAAAVCTGEFHTLLALVADVPEAAQLLHRRDVQPLLHAGRPHSVQVRVCLRGGPAHTADRVGERAGVERAHPVSQGRPAGTGAPPQIPVRPRHRDRNLLGENSLLPLPGFVFGVELGQGADPVAGIFGTAFHKRRLKIGVTKTLLSEASPAHSTPAPGSCLHPQNSAQGAAPSQQLTPARSFLEASLSGELCVGTSWVLPLPGDQPGQHRREAPRDEAADAGAQRPARQHAHPGLAPWTPLGLGADIPSSAGGGGGPGSAWPTTLLSLQGLRQHGDSHDDPGLLRERKPPLGRAAFGQSRLWTERGLRGCI